MIGFSKENGDYRQFDRSDEQTAGPSTASLAMKLRETSLRMTHLLQNQPSGVTNVGLVKQLEDGHARFGV
jgi:hypothetical protein